MLNINLYLLKKNLFQEYEEHNKSISSSMSDDDCTDISENFLDEENLNKLNDKSENLETKMKHTSKENTQSVK